MRVGSLFAGIGGFDLAAERTGHTIAWQSEVDPHASNVLAHHWPDAPNLGDIHDITSPDPVDIVCGGFPCQDYSVAGAGAGLAGDRGALWWQMRRVIAECRPAWVVAENVPGLTTSRHIDSFRTIVGSLVELGYGVVWRVLDAQWFGVAQRRRRLFIVGHSGGIPRPEILSLGQSVCGDSPPRREPGKDVAPSLAARTNGGGGLGTDAELDGALIASSLTASHAYDQAGSESWLIPTAFNWQSGGDVRLDPTEEHSGTLTSHQTPAVAFAQNQRDEIRDLGDLAGGLAAQPGMNQQTYISSPTVRRLTPLECERLQGFPDNWTHIPGNSDTQRYRQLGNAVAVPVAEHILSMLDTPVNI